ncbi:folylpolyglutamate synthase [Halalkalibacter okhensis]|uniref:Dihydrofolate synthase/folylpolyglutamate synthase n=2 Tax=Halalkalibacter okhensis TaxID=333138 RepID=A0A0B0IMR5_9BACI|nr:folylpolyglutamate synthase [Halalkalibacter okhensis]
MEVIEWIHSLLPFGIKPGLKRMEWMLKRLGNPEQKMKVVHIGGTNGKGSTVSFMRHVLEKADYNVGTFTSPYIERFEERISLNGQPIDEHSLVESANKIRPLVEELAQTELGSPTEFEVITTIAFDYFAHVAKPDIVLLEVGLGGRLDSTNVITPLLSVITSIGFDHMHILGETLGEIAFEKAGIIKRNTPIVSGIAQKEAQEIIMETAKEKQAPYFQLREHFEESLVDIDRHVQSFTYTSDRHAFENVTIQMPGPHQRENASVAICALELLIEKYGFIISAEAIREGLKATTWIGRFEKLNEHPLVVIDGAHNQEGMESLAKTLILHYPKKTFRFLLAATKEKDMGKLLKPFEGMDASFTFTSFDFFRAASSQVLFDQAAVEVKRYEDQWEKALAEEVQALKDEEMLVVAGSLYFISAIREEWRKNYMK